MFTVFIYPSPHPSIPINPTILSFLRIIIIYLSLLLIKSILSSVQNTLHSSISILSFVNRLMADDDRYGCLLCFSVGFLFVSSFCLCLLSIVYYALFGSFAA